MPFAVRANCTCKNVEWAAWTSDSAIDWLMGLGRQLRVLSIPNLMRPGYREACLTDMENLTSNCSDLRNALPENNKHRLTGLKLGW